MSNVLPSFPLACLDVRESQKAKTHWVLVLQGGESPPELPVFSHGENIAEVVVDEQGRWGSFEWSSFPQKYDPRSPWLSFIPIYRDNHHITRSTIHRHMVIQIEERIQGMKEPLLFTAESGLCEKIKEYAKGTVALAESALSSVRKDHNLVGLSDIAWPTETIRRATHLWRQIVVGVPSVNCFKRALSCLRRETLELEGFFIWASCMQTTALNRVVLAAHFKTEKRIVYRGAFLDGSTEDWLDAGSELRRVYSEMVKWGTPVFALVGKGEWALQHRVGLSLGRGPFIPSKPIEGA